jgi:Zn finger protein HypA/HybF involved in hydrogenase expression
MYKYKYKTTEDFIKRSKSTHGDKYDYSESNYINAKTKIKINCKKHGPFYQIPRNHIRGHDCPKCSGCYMDKDYFILKSEEIHNKKYDYQYIKYTNNTTKVDIICPIHNVFQQKPKDHLLGKGCPKCGGKNIDTNDFIMKAKIIHGDKYDYNQSHYINATTKLKINCRKHGLFEQSPNPHLNGKGCPNCKTSKGEMKIKSLLDCKGIKYIQQHKFPDCKNIKPLLFDFFLPDYNTCIEFQGGQHIKSVNYFGGEDSFKLILIRDEIKDNYCNDKKINLIKIYNITDIVRLITDIN